ncbi:MAG: DUF6328 family protein [Solirubrobacteraceae bacterium]
MGGARGRRAAGVQVLFAFPLVAPFNRVGSVRHFERPLYFATLLCTLLASILLIAPTVIHRLESVRARRHTWSRSQTV